MSITSSLERKKEKQGRKEGRERSKMVRWKTKKMEGRKGDKKEKKEKGEGEKGRGRKRKEEEEGRKKGSFRLSCFYEN